MSDITSRMRDAVASRAQNRCEYCQLSQLGQEAAFHVDHVLPRNEGGITTLENLALACVSCSLRKWARTSAIDPDSSNEVPLFNPRTMSWRDHFEWDAERLNAKTPVGRATVAALAMNRSVMLSIRAEEMILGRHPPQDSNSDGD